MKKIIRSIKQVRFLSLTFIGVLVLSACGPSATPAPTQDVALIQTQAAQTVVADLRPKTRPLRRRLLPLPRCLLNHRPAPPPTRTSR